MKLKDKEFNLEIPKHLREEIKENERLRKIEFKKLLKALKSGQSMKFVGGNVTKSIFHFNNK